MASETMTEAGHAAAEHADGMPQLDFSTFPNQIFWLVVALLVIYIVLSRVALPRIGSVLSERHGAITHDIEQAAELKRKAEEAEVAYNAALAEARAEAQVIVAEAKADIQKDLDKAIAKADGEIAAKAAESATSIAEIQASATKSIEEVANATIGEIVKSVMPGMGDAKSLKAAVANRMKG